LKNIYNIGLSFSWAGFVFLSINFLIGVSLSKITIENFIISTFAALIFYILTMIAPIFISIKYNINFSQALNKFLNYKMFVYFFIGIVVFVNLGWYSIQLEVIKEILNMNSIIYLLLFAYLFAYGAFRFGYIWIKNFSIIVMGLFLLYLIYFFIHNDITISFNNIDIYNISFNEILKTSISIYGVWAFSSSSIIMDIAKKGENFLNTFISLLIGLILGFFLLLYLGYFLSKFYNINSFYELNMVFGSLFAIVLLVLNIWTTNDSNFYSSMLALESIGIKKVISFILLPFISVALVYFYKDNLYNILSKWLYLMSYIGFVFTAIWWYIIIKQLKLKRIKNET